MSNFTGSTGKILRQAGTRTAVLQVFSAVLLVLLIFLYVDMWSRQKSLRDGIRENAMWAVFQIDRESRRLSEEVQLAAVRGDASVPTLKAIAQRYDIVYSRTDLLRKGRFQDFFDQNDDVSTAGIAVRDDVNALDHVFTKLDKAPDGLQRMTASVEPLKKLVDDTNALLLATNKAVSERRAESRDDLAQLEHTSSIYLILLVGSVGFLIFTLRRQLLAVKNAGLGLETMANDLASAYTAADAGNRAKSQFMATMGHEIRTPLNAILGTAELLQLSNPEPDVNASLQTIRTSGEALLEILNEILDYSKIEYGKLDVEMRRFSVPEFANNVMDMMRGRAKEHGDVLVLDMPKTVERPWVKTDPTRLRQIVLNLMSNAIKFTSDGTVTLRMREISGPNGACLLRIEVQDTGIGIDEEGCRKLFKPFSQVDASISRRFGGTGLGLTISKEIAERLGGDMGVESEKGKGSTFWVQIPVERVSAPEELAPNDRPTGMDTLPRLRVLLVEDNKINQQIATRFLERLGQVATIAADGLQAVNAAAADRYDIILMDMQMPVMDGIQAAREIRQGGGINASTPIVAMTANASDEDRQSCMEAGMNGFELKPITLARLHAVLSTARPGSEPSDEAKAPTVAQPVAEVVSLPVAPASAVAIGSYDIDPARRAELIEALGEEIFDELVESFVNDARDLLKEYKAALVAADEHEADKALHTLKGAAANVGFNTVSVLAQNMRATPLDNENYERLAACIPGQVQDKAA